MPEEDRRHDDKNGRLAAELLLQENEIKVAKIYSRRADLRGRMTFQTVEGQAEKTGQTVEDETERNDQSKVPTEDKYPHTPYEE